MTNVSYDFVYSHLLLSRLYRVYCSFISTVNHDIALNGTRLRVIFTR